MAKNINKRRPRRSKAQKAAEKAEARATFEGLKRDYNCACNIAPDDIRIQARTLHKEHKNRYSIKSNIWVLMQVRERGTGSTYQGELISAWDVKAHGIEIIDDTPYLVYHPRKLGRSFVWSIQEVYDISQTRDYIEDQQHDAAVDDYLVEYADMIDTIEPGNADIEPELDIFEIDRAACDQAAFYRAAREEGADERDQEEPAAAPVAAPSVSWDDIFPLDTGIVADEREALNAYILPNGQLSLF